MDQKQERFVQKCEKLLAGEDVHVSPNFQCDQTGGYPVSLCVNWEEGKAWLKLNDSLARDGEDLSSYERLCADWGIRACESTEDFNRLLEELGEDAFHSAYLPEENEGEVMKL